MDALFAKQPIFDSKSNIMAYELLYRNESENSMVSNWEMTIDVVTNALINFGFNDLSEKQRVFINFDEKLLMGDLINLLDPKMIVVELLETIEPSSKLIDRINYLKELGYVIALDDYLISYPHESLVELSDIIKVDFLGNNANDIVKIAQRFSNSNKLLLAEKVENELVYDYARKLGYELFQGFYFSRPQVHRGNFINSNQSNCLKIMHKLSTYKDDADVNFIEIARIIERDPALTYKIIKLANAKRANLYKKINTVKTAITLLGYNELRKWIHILFLQENATRKSSLTTFDREVLKNTIFRTFFIEKIFASNPKIKAYVGESVLSAIIDFFDIMYDIPLDDVLSNLDVSESIKSALLYGQGYIGDMLRLIKSYEAGSWEELDRICSKLNINIGFLGRNYEEALKESNEIFKELF